MIIPDIKENVVLTPVDVRFKQTSDTRYFAVMNCAVSLESDFLLLVKQYKI